MSMKTVILCGGQGTRLREETEYRPKPLVEVGGRPILWHIMKLYAHYGHKEFVMCLGYRGDMIKRYFLSYRAMSSDITVHLGGNESIDYHGPHDEQDFSVTLVDTGQTSMTGARIKRIQQHIEGTFMATYGDGVSDVNISDLLDFHRHHGKLATITCVRPRSRFGIVAVDSDMSVSGFAEKPVADGWISAGFFVFEPEVFGFISDADNCVLEREPIEALAAAGEIKAYCHDGSFHSMDTYREYLSLNELWQRDDAPWKVWR